MRRSTVPPPSVGGEFAEPRHESHIVQRGKRYHAVVYEGTDPATGKRIRRWYAAGDTRRSAEELLTEIVERVHDGDDRAPDRITLGDYLVERWLPTKRAQLRRSTFDSYRSNVENHVVPRIGDVALPTLVEFSRDDEFPASGSGWAEAEIMANWVRGRGMR